MRINHQLASNSVIKHIVNMLYPPTTELTDADIQFLQEQGYDPDTMSEDDLQEVCDSLAYDAQTAHLP